MVQPSADEFRSQVSRGRARHPGKVLAIPLSIRLLADQLTPVLGYRRLVADDERTAPSFLLESVEGGERQGRYSIMGARPILRIAAHQNDVTIAGDGLSRIAPGSPLMAGLCADPLTLVREASRDVELLAEGDANLPKCVLGGWFGYAGYDSVRYAEPEKLPWTNSPRDDRHLADLHFSFYDGVVVFDHVAGIVHVVQLALVGPQSDAMAAHVEASQRLSQRVMQLSTHAKALPLGEMPQRGATNEMASNLTRAHHAEMIARAKEYIAAGDIFQVVLGQRFERRSSADPFDVYRALRAVNPSPYMVYLQCPHERGGCILVASSPEILCRVRKKARRHEGNEASSGVHASSAHALDEAFELTNRPLAGTRKRGATAEEDAALERELLADPKERAEHIMLVDLGRNDVGRVSVPGSIDLPRVMEVERYSHVMHISSTVTGELRAGLDCWDALRAALPVGTISGAPKVRAMQIIDELETVRRGPYGGGMGYVGLDGQMDIALALRTMVVPMKDTPGAGGAPAHPTGTFGVPGEWTYFIQASGGIVADSQPEAEFMETVNKAASSARAIDVAERAFGNPPKQ
jgi:anthranilate synthase component 1